MNQESLGPILYRGKHEQKAIELVLVPVVESRKAYCSPEAYRVLDQLLADKTQLESDLEELRTVVRRLSPRLINKRCSTEDEQALQDLVRHFCEVMGD